MKTYIKKFAIPILIILVFGISSIFAGAQPQGQQGPPPIPNAKQVAEMVDEISETLSLTDEQNQQISDLYIAHFAEARELMETKSGERGANRQKMETLRSTFESKINKVLSKDQQKLFKKLQESHQPKQQR